MFQLGGPPGGEGEQLGAFWRILWVEGWIRTREGKVKGRFSTLAG